jgi:hypothetical protein
VKILEHIKQFGLRGTCFIIPFSSASGLTWQAVAMAAISLNEEKTAITLESFKAQFEKFGRKTFNISDLDKMIEENRARIFDCSQVGLTQDL